MGIFSIDTFLYQWHSSLDKISFNPSRMDIHYQFCTHWTNGYLFQRISEQHQGTLGLFQYSHCESIGDQFLGCFVERQGSLSLVGNDCHMPSMVSNHPIYCAKPSSIDPMGYVFYGHHRIVVPRFSIFERTKIPVLINIFQIQ
jgi:hypothetical protein